MIDPTTQHELAQFNDELAQAARNKNRVALERMLHDDFLLVDIDGKLLQRQEWVDSLIHPASSFAATMRRHERQLSLSPDGNTVTEVADVDLTATLLGADRSGLYINTATYVRGPDGWKLLAHTWQPGQSCPGCCGSMTVRRTCAVCGREGVDALLPAHA